MEGICFLTLNLSSDCVFQVVHSHTRACQELGFFIYKHKHGAVTSGCACVMLEMPSDGM